MRTGPKLAWRKDVPDARDLFFVDRTPLKNIPSHIDLRDFCSPVENQGIMGSCTGHAVTAAVELIHNQETGSYRHLSRLFVYYNGRLLDGWPEADDGATIRSCVKAVNKRGIPYETRWPYLRRNLLTAPPKEAYDCAEARKVVGYQRINSQNLNAIRRALSQRLPVVFGFEVYDSFMSATVERTGRMRMPKAGEVSTGGHAVVAVGYDDTKKVLIVRNSWGKEWGDGGYFYMPYAFATDPNECDDFWTLY